MNLSSATTVWMTDHHLRAGKPELVDLPDATPLLVDVSGVPPANFTVGTLNPLLDDTFFMGTNWLAAGHETELDVIQEAPHGLDCFLKPGDGRGGSDQMNS